MNRAKNFTQFINESSNNMGLFSRELKEFNPELTQEIENWVNYEIILFDQNISPEEAAAIQEFMEKSRVDMDWEVYRDGTINVALFTQAGRPLIFEWEDEDGHERRGNLLNYVTRGITTQIDPNAESGEFKLPQELINQLESILPSKPIDKIWDTIFTEF